MPTQFEASTPVLRNPRVVWRAFQDEVAIIAPWVASVRTLNAVGARCWELADGRTFGEIVDALEGEFDVARGTLEADLREFLGALENRELLAAAK